MKSLKIYSMCIMLILAALVFVSCTNRNGNGAKESDLANETTKPSDTIKEDTSVTDTFSEPETTTTTTTTFTERTESTEPDLDESEDKINIESSVTAELQTDTTSSIPYPIFSDIENAEQVNQLILDYVNELKNLYNGDYATLHADYQIMFQNEKYISIYFLGDVRGAAYPHLFKSTLNIDITTANRLTLSQLVNLDDDFVNLFNDEAQLQFESIGVNMAVIVSPDSIMDKLEQADMTSSSDIQSYFTADEIVIHLATIHAIGDYIEVRIPLASIENYIF